VRRLPRPRGGPHTPGRHAGRLAGGSGTATRVARHPLRRARAAVTDLFDATPHEAPSTAAPAPPAPLADRMRPRALDEVLGQGHLLGAGKVLRSAIETGELHSMILWGPPGSGKTTLARLMAHTTGARFIAFSAVLAGVKEIREVVVEAERAHARQRTRTILFVDEIHRFNRAQQDAFLPHVEKGTLVLVGATTENPSFEVNSALLSRCRVYVLRALAEDDLVAITRRALGDAERGLAGLAPGGACGRPPPRSPGAPARMRSSGPRRRRRRMIFSGIRRGSPLSRRRRSTWPSRPSRTRCTSPTTRRRRTCGTGRRSPCRCTSAT